MDGNLLTFLQHSSNLRYSAFLNKLKKKIYSPKCSLHVEFSPSKEPVPFSDLSKLNFKPLNIGDSWGGFFDCAWMKFESNTQFSDTSNLVAVLDIGAEGCVYNSDGAVQGITNVMGMVDRFQILSGKKVVPLDNIGDFKNKKILFFADCGNNGKDGSSSGDAKLKRAEICEMRKDIISLYYDVMVCYQLVAALKDGSKKSVVKKYINSAIKASGNLSAEDVKRASNILKPMFDSTGKPDFDIYAVGHGHLDLAWLWPARESKRKAVRTFSNAIYENSLENNYVFLGSQPQQYEWVKENNPHFYERLKKAVADGAVEAQGGMWVEPDTNLPCGESLIRQCYYGKNFFEKEFGKDVKTLWLPDVFGYTAALPQIIKKSGMDSFMTIKLSWNNINSFPHHTFLWTGLDDSEVLVHMPPEGDYNSNATPYAALKTYSNYKEKDISNVALMSYGIGDGGGGPGEYHVNVAKRCENLRYVPHVKMATCESFFNVLKRDTSKYPKFKGELYLEKHQGTYTTQSFIKKYNRQCETHLHFAEWLSTLAFLKGKEYPHDKFDEIWKEVLLYQFHDILPGSSIQRVYDDCRKRYPVIEQKINSIITDAVKFLSEKNSVLTAVNPVDFKRSGYLKLNGDWYSYDVDKYSSALLKKAEPSKVVFAADSTIENDVLKVTFDDKGQIVSLFDKANDYNCVKTVFNAPNIYKDRFVHPYNAWDIDIKYTKQKPSLMKLISSKTYTDSNSAVRENIFTYGKSRLVQKIRLVENCPYVIVDNEVEWHETHKMLRMDAYPKNFCDKVLCDIQFGNIERSTKTDNSVDYAQFEIPAHKWVDVYDGGYGVAIVNNSKYGHRVKDGLISLNCLRSPVWPDKTADRGHHSFSYAIYPHKEQASESQLVQVGYEFNNPIKVVKNGIKTDKIIECDSKNIIIETIMVTRDGKIAVRLYETAGKSTDTSLKLFVESKNVSESNLIFKEEKPCDVNLMHFKPFEIKTVLIEVNKS